MQPTDEELFLAVKNDDYLSYNQLFTRLYRRLCLFVFDYTRDESASEDIVQELFLKLWIDRKRINIRETVSSYLYKFAKNAAFNYLRSEKNRQKVIERLPLDEPVAGLEYCE